MAGTSELATDTSRDTRNAPTPVTISTSPGDRSARLFASSHGAMPEDGSRCAFFSPPF
jgi:hypothetical protein